MTSKQIEAVFTLAGVEISAKWRLVNQYYGDTDSPHPESYSSIVQNPWWLVRTSNGIMITVGCRKRVIHVGWDFDLAQYNDLVSDPGSRTICSNYIHAWDLTDVSLIIGKLAELHSKQCKAPVESMYL